MNQRFSVPGQSQQLLSALRACRGALVGAALTSAIINCLYLAGSFFMLEVYDRVLPSRSVPTLIGLAILLAVLYGFQGFFDTIRSRLLVRVGSFLVEKLSGAAFDAFVQLPLSSGAQVDRLQPLRSLDQIRSFLSGMGPPAFFDLPWMPFYLFICFLVHPWIGWTATCGALLICTVALLTEFATRRSSTAGQGLAIKRQLLADASRRNAEVLSSMGMRGNMLAIWRGADRRYLRKIQDIADITGGLGALSKVLRMVVQSAVLAVGAYLVINEQASGGVIIASSVLAARALAPVELVVGHWQSFMLARLSWTRLSEAFALMQRQTTEVQLPPPTRSLTLEKLCVAPPDSRRNVVQGVDISLTAGDGLGIIGPSASGKSSLVRAIAGVWRPSAGFVRLDGALLDMWDTRNLGRHIGYLPQNVELFAGTVAQNIGRFASEMDSEAVISAARLAGLHEMILRLPDGYETEVGDGGALLSSGQRQRVALARAVYGNPFLVVLDEPNSNLDMDGETALSQALMEVRRRGGIVIVAAHRPSALAAVNVVLMMQDGKVQAVGPRDEILTKVTRMPIRVQQDKTQAASEGI